MALVVSTVCLWLLWLLVFSRDSMVSYDFHVCCGFYGSSGLCVFCGCSGLFNLTGVYCCHALQKVSIASVVFCGSSGFYGLSGSLIFTAPLVMGCCCESTVLFSVRQVGLLLNPSTPEPFSKRHPDHQKNKKAKQGNHKIFMCTRVWASMF